MITHACKALGWSRNKTATQKQPLHNKLRNLSLAILLTLGTSLAWSHPADTTSTVSLPTTVTAGSIVDVTGKVLTTGHGTDVVPEEPVLVGTMQIQICVDDGLAAPSAQCDAVGATGDWTLCSAAPSPCTAPASGTPNIDGEFTVAFNTSWLAGQVIGFRAHYVTPGGAHAPGTTSSGGSDMTILGSYVLELPVDIKPGSCPNPLNINAKGVLPVAILGSATVSAEDIDPASVKLEGVTALRTDVEDVGEPFYPLTGKADALDCNELPPDGWADLTVKFNLQDVVTALNTIEPLSDGQERVLMVTGKLLDGTDFVGEDVVQILKKK
jgi:hypothetical protein